ncbi:glutamate receptor ionotropic, kainate 2-like [Phymastichus coffea]|uniref:glutamate receptor ionotropic, kainate 2-like n=1 Tax=Phymastichus coffea TaxID=108790 RepID=UPI00273C2876|nr:glutamate receptor ionotropic, kainate 2-like [Phymastichus coffea]
MDIPSKAAVCLLFAVHHMIATQGIVREITTLIEDVRNLYLSPSIFIVYNRRHYGFEREKILMEAVRTKSRRYSMSQAIGYDDLAKTPTYRENALYALLIHDTKSLQLAVDATKNIDMSLHPWLLLSMNSSDLDCNNPGRNFFKLRMDAKMTAKCDGDSVLKKYYAIFDNRTEVVDVAQWTSGKLSMFENSSLDLVTNMTGVVLKLAKRSNPKDTLNENTSKFVAHVVRDLEHYGQFRGEVTRQDKSMGRFNRNTNNWSGLMRIMTDKQADIGMVLFSLSNSRMNVVDFAIPLARARFHLYAKLPDKQQIRWDAYFQTFNANTWTAIGLSVLAFSALLCAMNLHTLTPSSFFEQFTNVWGIFSQQGLAEDPSNAASKILSFSILYSSLIIHAIYSASITSYITQLTADMPFSSYEEFLRDVNYKITVLKESRDEDLFLDNTDKQLSPLLPRLKHHCFRALSPYEGFSQACEPNTVFYSDEVTFDGITNPPCKLGSVDMKRTEHMSFVLTKNSPYTRAISHFICRLREHGILMRLRNEHFYKFTEIPETHPNVISFEEILPILSILIVGAVVALFIWLLEIIVHLLAMIIK